MSRPNYAACVVALIALGGLLRIAFYTGPIGSDDSSYYAFAQQILDHGQISELNHHAARLVFLLTIGAIAALAGSIFWGLLLNIALSLFNAWMIYRVIKQRWGEAIGLVGLVMMLFAANDIIYASVLTPDILLSTLMLSAIVLVYGAESQRVSGFTPWRALAAGILTGLAYSTKDNGILLAPPMLAWAILDARGGPIATRLRSAGTYLAGLAVVFVLVGGGYWLLAGDFWYRQHAIVQVHNATIVEAADLHQFVQNGYWALMEGLRGHDGWMFGMILVVGAFAACMLMILERGCSGLAWVAGFFLLYTFFGSSSLTRYVNLPFQDRYLLPFLPMASLCVADLMGRLRGHWSAHPKLVAAIASGLLATHVYGGVRVAAQESGTIASHSYYCNVATAIDILATRGAAVHVDQVTFWHLRHFVPPSQLREVRVLTTTSTLEPGYYIVNNVFRKEYRSDPQHAVIMMHTTAAELNLFDRIQARPVVMELQSECSAVARFMPAHAGRVATRRAVLVYEGDQMTAHSPNRSGPERGTGR